jgi:glycosyltransferase involved in cell wall biosynthesis
MSCPRVDIITPAFSSSYLEEAYESILAQVGVQWRWLIQADRDLGPLPGRISADERVSCQLNPGTYGTAVTRNRALMRSTAELVFALDHDDVLYPGALLALAQALAEPQALECYGAWGETYTFAEGSAPTLFKGWDISGVLPAGSIADPFMAGMGLRLHCGSLLWRREHLMAFGGWTALRQSEDTRLVIACDALFPSSYVPVPVYGYRTGHNGQQSAEPQFSDEMAQRHEFVRASAQALRNLFKQTSDPPPRQHDLAHPEGPGHRR